MKAVLDDHLLRDLLADDPSVELRALLVDHEPATTNMYVYRLSRSVVSAAGGALTGGWEAERRRALGARLTDTSGVEIVPMRILAFRMAVLADQYRLSTLGAESVAAAEALMAPLCVWQGDTGPAIEAAVAASGQDYLRIA